MPAVATPIKDLLLLEPQVFGDERGWFTEKMNTAALAEAGFSDRVVQVNHSFSVKGVLRGLHFQRAPHDQSKIVFCVRGRLFDVAVDVRPGSPTCGKWYGVELSSENRRGLLVPRGFAHGFYALDDCELLYLCGNASYDKAAEGGLRWDDPAVGVEWPLDGAPQVNERDAAFGGLADLQV
jgi:dTDP-4-dehydrorhamnose 3,5-epimerase